MRKLCVVLGLVAFVLAMASVAWAGNNDSYLKTKQVHWGGYKDCTTTVGTWADSATRALGAVTDTTNAIDISDLDWDLNANALSTTAAPFMRVYLTSPNTTANLDTLKCIVDESGDGTNWRQATSIAAVGTVGPGFTATSKQLSFVLTQLPSQSTQAWLYSKYIRLRLTIVTGTFTAAKCEVRYPHLSRFD